MDLPDLISPPEETHPEEGRPTILLLDDDQQILWQLGAEMAGRYGADYDVISFTSAAEALDRLAADECQVALLVADQWMEEMPGVEFLSLAHEIHPRAKRALLVDFSDSISAPVVLQAMTLGRIDNYLLKPWVPADDSLHPMVTELLSEWTRAVRGRVPVATIIGEDRAPRSHELRDLFDRNSIPYVFVKRDCDRGRSLISKHVQGDCTYPVVVFNGGPVLMQPTNIQLAQAVGVGTSAPEGVFDLAIVGAGPAGLSAAVYGASEGLRVVVVESRAIGGQAATSSLIRNYLGFPRGLSGANLAERAYRQAWLFGTEFVFMQDATSIRVAGDHRVITLSDGSEIASRAIVLSTGVSYRRLDVPGIDSLLGAGVFYGAATAEAQVMANQDVYVVGAGNSGGQTAIHLAKYARKVTLLARGDSLAQSMSDYLIKEVERTPNMEVRLSAEVVEGRGRHRLEGLLIRDRESGVISELPADALFILIGAVPRTDWIGAVRDDWGFLLTGRQLLESHESGWNLPRPPFPMETSIPGVFAVGDVRSRSVKRVAAAVGEGSSVVSLVHAYLNLSDSGRAADSSLSGGDAVPSEQITFHPVSS